MAGITPRIPQSAFMPAKTWLTPETGLASDLSRTRVWGEDSVMLLEASECRVTWGPWYTVDVQ